MILEVAAQMSGPMPSPSMNGMIGRSGTSSWPAEKAIGSPSSGTWAYWYGIWLSWNVWGGRLVRRIIAWGRSEPERGSCARPPLGGFRWTRPRQPRQEASSRESRPPRASVRRGLMGSQLDGRTRQRVHLAALHSAARPTEESNEAWSCSPSAPGARQDQRTALIVPSITQAPESVEPDKLNGWSESSAQSSSDIPPTTTLSSQ